MQWENTLAAAQIIDDNSTSGSKKYAGSERGLAGDHDLPRAVEVGYVHIAFCGQRARDGSEWDRKGQTRRHSIMKATRSWRA